MQLQASSPAALGETILGRAWQITLQMTGPGICKFLRQSLLDPEPLLCEESTKGARWSRFLGTSELVSHNSLD